MLGQRKYTINHCLRRKDAEEAFELPFEVCKLLRELQVFLRTHRQDFLTNFIDTLPKKSEARLVRQTQEKKEVYWLSDKIIRTAYITQRAVGNKRDPLNDDQERESLCR
jgi:hypothetical protein